MQTLASTVLPDRAGQRLLAVVACRHALRITSSALHGLRGAGSAYDSVCNDNHTESTRLRFVMRRHGRRNL
jgi:hypothetical protein